MRFRKRVKVFPGFAVNFSTSGVSATIGGKGASINIGKKGTYLNTSIPALGIYSRQKLGSATVPVTPEPEPAPVTPSFTPSAVLPGAIQSAEAATLTSTTTMEELRDTIYEAFRDRQELISEMRMAERQLRRAKNRMLWARLFIFGFFFGSFRRKVYDQEDYIIDLRQQYDRAVVDIDIEFDEATQAHYQKLVDAYRSMISAECIWDMTSSVHNDRVKSRSAAGTSITRNRVKLGFDALPLLRTQQPPLHWGNANGGDLYFYPGFCMMVGRNATIGLIALDDISLAFMPQRFLETEKIPHDSEVIDQTWTYVNKSGLPDRRFSYNPQIPIVRYGEIEFRSASGLHEVYVVSHFKNAEAFSQAFHDYQRWLGVHKPVK